MLWAQVCWYARMTSRSSSGSSCVERAVDPTRSQNSTVNCRRSASAAAERIVAVVREAAGRLAFLVLVVPWRLRLLAGNGFPAAASAVPQLAQNFAWGRLSYPHPRQEVLTAPPHSIQNLAPSGFSNPQLAQRMLPLYSFRLMRARKRLASFRRAATDLVATLATLATPPIQRSDSSG